VFTPTLTGVAERSHLLSREINLEPTDPLVIGRSKEMSVRMVVPSIVKSHTLDVFNHASTLHLRTSHELAVGKTDDQRKEAKDKHSRDC